MGQVFLLWHSHGECDVCGEESSMLLGVYSSREKAEARQAEAALLAGFRRFPQGFVIDPYEVNCDEWTTGFATTAPDGGWVPDPDPPTDADG